MDLTLGAAKYSLIQLKMVGPFVIKTSSRSDNLNQYLRQRELLVTVGNDTEMHDNKTITDFVALGIAIYAIAYILHTNDF